MRLCAAIALVPAAALALLSGPELQCAAAQGPEPAVRRVAVEGTRFRITLADGRVLAQEALPGVILEMGDGSGRRRRIRIDSVQTDPKNLAGEVMLYGFSEQEPDGSWRNACQPDPEGRRMGFPLPGAFTADGRYVPASGQLLLTCTGGAEGKCIRFGYHPWGRGPDGTDLAPYYQACVRMVRADYCGDGVGHTRNGMPVDIFDRIGLQADETAPGMTLEAVWAPEGAVCVRHTRLPVPGDVEGLAATCPRLAGHVGAGCDETAPGLLFNRSVPPP